MISLLISLLLGYIARSPPRYADRLVRMGTDAHLFKIVAVGSIKRKAMRGSHPELSIPFRAIN